jgi:hypothetical protein
MLTELTSDGFELLIGQIMMGSMLKKGCCGDYIDYYGWMKCDVKSILGLELWKVYMFVFEFGPW